jgi:hypothetical protein
MWGPRPAVHSWWGWYVALCGTVGRCLLLALYCISEFCVGRISVLEPSCRDVLGELDTEWLHASECPRPPLLPPTPTTAPDHCFCPQPPLLTSRNARFAPALADWLAPLALRKPVVPAQLLCAPRASEQVLR